MNSVTIHGTVTRKPYTSDKFAAFSVRPNPEPGAQRASPILDVVAFDAAPLAAARTIEEGNAVVIQGHLGAKKATAKDRSTVQVDGRDLWIMQVIADQIESSGMAAGAPAGGSGGGGRSDYPSRQPQKAPSMREEPPPPSDDDIPF